jgi:2'-5' RNA ligase
MSARGRERSGAWLPANAASYPKARPGPLPGADPPAGVASVPPAWVHVTIQHVAPVDAVIGEEIAKIIGVVRDGCAQVAPFELTVGQPEVWGTGIVCPIWPGALARRLWDITAAAARQMTGGRFGTRPAAFRPHLALAYCFASISDGPPSLPPTMARSRCADLAGGASEHIPLTLQITAPDEAFRLLEDMRGPDGSLTRDIASTTARKPARSAGPASTQP